jgi:AH receptor-interacting protein
MFFRIEIIKVEQPDEYEKDSWLLNSAEQTELIPKLKVEGNDLYKQCLYAQAADKYFAALNYLERLMLR